MKRQIEMPERPERAPVGGANGGSRFDGDAVRRILSRAAAEQQRLDSKLSDTYSLEEVEEMAAEAGISPEALRAALERPTVRRTSSWRWMPAGWSPATRGIVLLSAAALALFVLLLAFPVVGYALLWVAIVLSVLILLGASPV